MRSSPGIHTAIGSGLVLLALLAGLPGCSQEAPDDAVLRLGLSGPPRGLDPRFATDAASERINRLLYRQLVELDDQGRPTPGIATWEELAPTHYRIRLGRRGRDFTDGTRLNADDVAATYAYVLDPANASPRRSQLGMIAAIEVVGPDALDVRLSRPDPLFPAYLAEGILPAEVLASGRRLTTDPVGSGPFRLLGWPEPGRLSLERRSDGQRVEIIAVKDPNVRVMKLLRGELDLLQNDLAPELVDYLAERPRLRVEVVPGRNFSYLGFNLEDPLAGSLALRRAMAHALDRESLVRYLFRGRAGLAEAIFPPGHWAGCDALSPYGHDPGRARELMATLGYGPGRPLELTLKTSSDPFRVRLATAMQAQLEPVGIRLKIRSYDWGTFFGDVKAGRFQLFGLTWVGINTPDIFRYAFHSGSIPPAGANRGRYRDAEVDALIDAASSAQGLTEQAELYCRLQTRLHAELPYLPLWYESQVLVTGPRVRGYRLASDGSYDGLETAEVVSDGTGSAPR